MKIFIVTPSFNHRAFLMRCVASVADQAAACRADPETRVEVHHHVQDGGSTDGTVAYLSAYAEQHATGAGAYRFTFASEADEGMYDAINKGFALALGEPSGADRGDDMILCHLNCDEQYLPGGLCDMAGFFRAHPEADVVLADMIVVDGEGAYICHRRSLKPHPWLSRLCCVGMTTTTFLRAGVVRDMGVVHDTTWLDLGDMVWYNEMHRAGARYKVYNRLVALFTDTGQNRNLKEQALRERKRYADEYLGGIRWVTRAVSKFYSLRRFLKEFTLKPPKAYALYWDDLTTREERPIHKPRGLWHRKGPSLKEGDERAAGL